MTEDSNTEFKSSFSDAVIETLSAFANTKGGRVLIGIDDNGKPVAGFTMGTESLQNWVNEVKIKTQPSIIPDADFIKVLGVMVSELSVKEFPIKPVSFRGRYFKRVNNSNHQLSLSEIAGLHLQSFNSSWDSYVNPGYSLESVSLEKVVDFIDRSNKDKGIVIQDDPLTVLTKFELIKEGGVTNACHLLFSKNDVFDATIELGRFSTPTSIKDGLTIRSDLFTEVEEVLNFIRKHINKEYIISGDPRREEKWQYPLPAIREIAVNMIVHRDYMHYGDSSIKIYNDRIEFFNPGRLPEGFTIQQLESSNYISQARNKKIASIFKEAQLIEKYGSGIRRIQESFIEYKLKPPLFENLQHGFQVTVYAVPVNTVGETVGETVGKTVGETSKRAADQIVEYIIKNPYITRIQLSQLSGLSVRGVEYNIKELKDKNKIKRIGSNKGGYWEVRVNN